MIRPLRSIRIRPEYLKEAKRHAAESDQTLGEWLEDAIVYAAAPGVTFPKETVEDFISAYGDQAYHKCADLIVEYAYANVCSIKKLCDVGEELARRGYPGKKRE